MSLQTIINHAESINVDRRPIVGQTISRAQYIKTAETGARVWKFIITPSNGWRYEKYRSVLEDLDFQDRITEEQINFANNTNLAWITAYQGELTAFELGQIRTQGINFNTIVLKDLPSVAPTTIIFKKGDYIQLENSRYPYTVTDNIVRGSNSTIIIPINRAYVVDGATTEQKIKVGNEITFRVIATNMPTWTIGPGRLIQWDGNFELMERFI